MIVCTNYLTWDCALCRLHIIIRATPTVYEGGYIAITSLYSEKSSLLAVKLSTKFYPQRTLFSKS